MDLQQLVLRIGGDSKGAESALGNVGAATNKMGGIIKAVIAGAAVAAMVKWTEATINLGIEAEKAAALLDATMKHTLNSTNEQVAACKSWAENQEKVNHFDAEELMAQLDKGIVKYGDLGTAQVAVSAAQEVARLKGIDVASAYSLVEQASNGMARSLKQFGIEAKDGTTQLQYLQQILDKADGSTAAYNKTTAGMIGAMKQSYKVMRETLGQALLPLVNTLMGKLSPIIENMTNYIIDNMPQIQSAIAKACDGIGEAFKVAGEVIRLVANDINWIITNAGIAINWINKTRVANETRAATNASAGDDFNLTGMLTPNPATNSVGTPLNIAGGRGTINRDAAANASDLSKGIVAVTHAYNGLSTAAVDSGIAASGAAAKASTAAADAAKKVADAAKAAAEAIAQSRQDIADKYYALTHTEQENEQRALDVEYAANVKSSKDAVASKTLYTAESKTLVQKYADAAKAIYQTISDKIYALTHTDFQNQQHVLDQEYAANLKNNVDKLQAKALYVAGCKALENEITKKEQEELDKRLEAQQKHNDDVAAATKTLMDKIDALTLSSAQQQAKDIATQAMNSYTAGVDPSIIAQYTKAATGGMITGSLSSLDAAVAGGQASLDAWAKKDAETRAAIAQYDSGTAVVKAVKDIGTTIVAAVTGVAPGVVRGINGMGVAWTAVGWDGR